MLEKTYLAVVRRPTNRRRRKRRIPTYKGQDYVICKINYSKGRKEKVAHHLNSALEIASLREWHSPLFWVHFDMVKLFLDEGKYDEAYAQLKQAQLHACDDLYILGRAMKLQAGVWFAQHRHEDAKSEAVHALENYEKVGATRDAGICRAFLKKVEQAIVVRPTGSQGELLKTILHMLRSLTSTFKREVPSPTPLRINGQATDHGYLGYPVLNAVSSTPFIQGHFVLHCFTSLFYVQSTSRRHPIPPSLPS